MPQPSHLPFLPSALPALTCSQPQTWNTACPSSSAASSLTHLSGSNSKPISYKKRSLIDNDYASCLYSIFIFQRPFTYIVSFYLLNNPARKQGEYDPHLTGEEMQLKEVRNLPQDQEPVKGRAWTRTQANRPGPAVLQVWFLDQ